MYEVGLGDSPMRISRKLNGNPRRYRELIAANPHKEIVRVNGKPTFRSLGVGEELIVPYGFVNGVGVDGFFSTLAKIVTAPITAPVHAIASVTSKIPVLGPITHIVDAAASAPANVAVAIASGQRLDHVAIDALKAQLKIVKEVAPYAQTVVSFVPGIGTGVAAAIGAGAALAEGQSITEVAKAAVRGALPGGAIAQAGFDTAMKVAAGGNVAQAALESARNLLPSDVAKKAFDVGLAVVTGEKIQTALTKGLLSIAPGQLQTVLEAGQKALASTPALAAAFKSIAPGGATSGFNLAAGLLSHTGLNEKALSAVRSQLPPDVVQGFDAALKTQISNIGWLKNVVNAPVVTAEALAQLAKLSPAEQKQLVAVQQLQDLAKLSAADQKKLIEMKQLQDLAKLPPAQQKQLQALTPTQQQQLSELAKLTPEQRQKLAMTATPVPASVAPKKAPAMPEPPKNVAAATPAPARVAVSAYAPYPSSMKTGVLGGCAPECRTLGAPVTDMSSGMRHAGLSAVNGSKGRPRMVRSPDGNDYVFSLENGTLTA